MEPQYSPQSHCGSPVPEATEEQKQLRKEMDAFVPNWGTRSDVRTVACPKGEDQAGMLRWAMEWHNNPLVLALMRCATGHVSDFLEPDVHPFFEQPDDKWRRQLYAALINTCWTDQRTGLEYGYSFREASAVVAFLTGVRGSRKGCYMTGGYCIITTGDWEGGFNESTGIQFVKSLGFLPGKYPRGRNLTGYSTCNFERENHNHPPPFPCLPKEMQLAIRKYADGTEGLAALADKLAPCLEYREPDPEEKRATKRARAEKVAKTSGEVERKSDEVRVNAPSEASGEDEDEEDEDDEMCSDCGYPNPGFCYCTR